MEPDPFATLTQVAGGYCLPRSLHVVADLGVADALDEKPRTTTDLAADVDAHPDALGRVLRLLAAHDIFALQGETVRHTPASRLLRTDHPQSMRAFARMFGLSVFWTTFGEMDHAVRTGAPATTEAFPEGFWGYLAEHPEAGRVFNAAMQAKAQGAIAGILATYDFSHFQTIADIGGGHGHLLHAILDAVPTATGVLFELPHVIAEVADVRSERLTLQAGDFFRDALPSCDAYLLMEIIHDWGDVESIAILRAVRQAASPGATVLIVEAIVPDQPGPAWAKMLDIHMLTLLGGRQRTQTEYAALLTQAGFRFMRQIDTGAGVAILEAQTASDG
ncbi:MAG: hydroxyneurosporene methyltransferase [Chloroflexota bacterium]|nr:hydroxyneurosporene methyltransferase [Chloroflexota bacterium]